MVASDEAVIAHGNDVFAVEVRGFDYIPEAERNMTLKQVDLFWVANSVNLFSVALGTLTITSGLPLGLAIAACAVGSLLYVYVSYGSIISVRAGLPVSTLSRVAFGIRGNLPNAFLSWTSSVAFEVINTIFGVDAFLALFQLFGWLHPGAEGKWLAVVAQLALCGGIAILGHATMIWFQRCFALMISAVLLVVIGFVVGAVDWAHPGAAHLSLSPAETLVTFLTACAAIASNPLSFIFNGADWVRYLSSATPGRRVFRHVFWSSYLPSLALTGLGAISATLGDMSDPVAGLKPLIPAWLFVLYILAVIGGSQANNIPTYYSSGLSLQAMGLKVHRNVATSLDVVVSSVITLYILFVQDFSTVLNDFIALLVVWVGPYGGVWMCDGYLRRGNIDFRAVHAQREAGRFWGWHGFNPAGGIALMAGMTAAALTMKSPVYDGPIAIALGGTDLSWVLGFPVAALVYAVVTRWQQRTLSGA